jgi:lipopolysaccharide/colanic/teichoic acid biosynthesis glycosyltransferase
LFDLLLVVLATLAAAVIRDNFEIIPPRLISVVPYLIITLSVAGFVLPTLGINRSLWQFASMRDGLRIVAATIMVVLGALAVGFVVNRLFGVARTLPVIQGLLIASFLIGARVLTRVSHDRRVRSAPGPSHSLGTILVIGLNNLTELYLQCLAEFDSGRFRIAGLLGDESQIGRSVHSHHVLGTPEQLAGTLRRLEIHGVFIDRIVVALPRHRLSLEVQKALSHIQDTTSICLEYLAERMGIESPPVDYAAKPASRDIVGSTAAAVDLVLERASYQRIKRAIDVISSAVLLIILAPLLLLTGLIVATDVGLPLVFWQLRPGLGGRPFRLYKFRTMADAHGPNGERKSDNERVSAVGNFLRQSRLDELPQLFNILKGDMSFVGPRPLLPVDQPTDKGSRLHVRPGLTGWAQIKGGRHISSTDKAALDVWYVRNMSFALDIAILCGTVPMLIFGERITETAIAQAWRDLRTEDIRLKQFS